MAGRQALRVITEALIDGWNFDIADGQILQFLPPSDDVGSITFGNSTISWDVKFFAGADGSFVLFDNGNKELVLSGVNMNTEGISFVGDSTWVGDVDQQGTWTPSGTGGVRRKVVDINTNTTLNSTHFNGYITNRNSFVPVVYTLPDTSTEGNWFEYWGVSAVTVTFKSETPDRLVAGFNDSTADSIAFDTVGEQQGARATSFYDGVQWHIQSLRGTATVTT